MKKDFILMADVIKSRKANAKKIARGLSLLVETTNKKLKQDILSPLTITLGDEFQAITKDLPGSLKMVIFLEELRIRNKDDFKLRYVLIHGKVETPINQKVAYGMLGEGLTKARETINELKKSEDRFFFFTGRTTNNLNKLFVLYQSIVDGWKTKDLQIVSDFIALDDYKLVAKKNKKTLSLMWKRRRSLKIKEYKIIKELIDSEYRLA